jgi:bifunctional non-homologous end joining protein LigD
MTSLNRNEVTSLHRLRSTTFPGNIEPMQPTLISHPFTNPAWIFEPKLDGFRAIAYNGKTVRIISRRGSDLTRYFKDLSENLKTIKVETVLDGEITAVSTDGRPCFECLQQHIGMKTEGPTGHVPWPYAIIYYIFDVLYLDGYDLTTVPLIERKKVLSHLIIKTGSFQLVDFFENGGKLVFEKAIEQGFEGVVAKRKDSIYELGKRTNTWLKAKASMIDRFVIGDYIISGKI